MSNVAMNAKQAYERYQAALAAGLIIQGQWHRDEGGRHLVCPLGVLGDEVDSSEKCPVQIMPQWLAQMVPWFFDGQSFGDAKNWGLRFYAELERLNGTVPFTVLHDWQANCVGPLAIEVAAKRKSNVAAHQALMEMQLRALGGQKFSVDKWQPILRAAFYDAGVDDAYVNANAYAYSNAFTYNDPDRAAYAYAYAFAYDDARAEQSVIKRLADGIIECLSRVQA